VDHGRVRAVRGGGEGIRMRAVAATFRGAASSQALTRFTSPSLAAKTISRGTAAMIFRRYGGAGRRLVPPGLF
jgi:hypothetical protein